MYLREVLDKAVLSADIDEGNDLVLVDPSIATWCDIPMVVHRSDWEDIFVSLRSKEPDIEVIWWALASRKDKALATFVASREEVSARYQQLMVEANADKAPVAEDQSQDAAESIKEDSSMQEERNSAGIMDGISSGMQDTMSDPFTPNIEAQGNQETEDSVQLGSMNEEAPVSLGDLLANTAYSPDNCEKELEVFTPREPFMGGEEEHPASVEEAPEPTEPEQEDAPTQEEEPAQEEPLVEAEPVLEAEEPPVKEEPTPAVEEEPAQEPEATPTVEEEPAGEVEPTLSEDTSEEVSAKDGEYEEGEEHSDPRAKVAEALATAFRLLEDDFREIFETVPVEQVIRTTYEDPSVFCKALNDMLPEDFKVASAEFTPAEWAQLMQCVYTQCTDLVYNGEKDKALALYKLLASLIYEEGE